MKEVENPFVIGKVVTGAKFADRKKEMAFLRREVKNGQNVIVISPRRYGKTSLVVNALEGDVDYVYVDCSLAESEAGLVEQLLNGYAGRQPLEKLALEAKKFLQDVEISLEIKPVRLKVQRVGQSGLEEAVTYVSRKTVVFDEFQDVLAISSTLPKKLRSLLQHKKKAFLFLGSKRHMMEGLFASPNSPFYNSGVVLHLEKIPREEFASFIVHWFKQTGVPLQEGDVGSVLSFSEGHPYYTQYACHFLWEKRRQGNRSPFPSILREIVGTNSDYFERLYSALSPNQKKALAVAATEKNVFSRHAIEKYGVPSTQHLQKALDALRSKELLDKNGGYSYIDLLFQQWILYRLVLNQKV